MDLNAPPLALYLHFPWCVRKCPYCDFNSHTLHGELPHQAYTAALLQDLEAQLADVAGRSLVSVFMGGGTPSLFPPDALGRLFEGLRQRLNFEPQAEITLEANPGTIERGRFADYRAVGINRVSLGAQSFDAQMLARLGRIHAAGDTRRAAGELHAAGLVNFNLDLMYALPGQDLAGALADLRAAIELEPAHLSHYQLTMEPGTVFGARPPGLPDDELSLDMQQHCQAELAMAGFVHYEVSAYARAGARCAHNLNYWEFGDYLGLGSGAHGKLTRSAAGQIVRTVREREPRRYLAHGHAAAPRLTVVPAADLPFEFMMNALRLVEGFPLARFEARTGLRRDWVVPKLHALAARGLIEVAGEGCRPTGLGLRFLNDVVADFLTPAVRDRTCGKSPAGPVV